MFADRSSAQVQRVTAMEIAVAGCAPGFPASGMTSHRLFFPAGETLRLTSP